MGNRLENIKTAIELIHQNIGPISEKSAVYESIAQGYKSENDYLNAVVVCQTEKLPEEVFQETQRIEIALGRKKTKLEYEDRPIDIDILIYDSLDFKHSSTRLIIPHARMLQRNFVIIPLLDVGDLTLKKQLFDVVTKKTITDFRFELKNIYIFTK